MAEDDKCLPQPLFCRDLSWDPFHGWPQRSRIFDQDFGLPPFPGPCDFSWRLGASSWSGYTRAPPFSSSAQTPLQPSTKLRQPLSGGVSEILTGQDRWQVNLDVNHFSPEEISIKTKEGYLEITGKHEERQDEHGFVSRYFTRKYKLPAGIELEHVSSSLSGDGVLSVEGPIPASSLPAETVIPIQVGETLESLDCSVKEDQVEVEAKTEETTGGETSEEHAAGSEELQTPPTQGPSDEPEGGEQLEEAPAVQSEPSVSHGEELQADSSEVMLEAKAAASGGEEVPAPPEGGTGEEHVDPKPAEEEAEGEKEPQEASGGQEDQVAPDTGVEEVAPDTGVEGVAPDAGMEEVAPDTGVEEVAPNTGVEGVAPDAGMEEVAPDTGVEEVAPDAGVEGVAPDAGVEGVAPDAGVEGQGEPGDPAQETEPPQDTAEEPAQEPPEPASAQEPEPVPIQEAPSPEQDVLEQREIEQVELVKGPPEL